MRNNRQMIKLVEVVYDGAHQYHLQEIIVNSSQIVSIKPDDHMAGAHAKGNLPAGLHEAQQFSKVTFTNGKEIVAVGTPEMIGKKTKKVLHG